MGGYDLLIVWGELKMIFWGNIVSGLPLPAEEIKIIMRGYFVDYLKVMRDKGKEVGLAEFEMLGNYTDYLSANIKSEALGGT